MIELRFDGPVQYQQFDRKQVRSAFGKAARIVAKYLKQSVGKRAGSGRSYRRGRTYTASAPGQPPVRLTGNLWRSVKGRASRRGYALVVQAIAPHAHLLELGTRLARPRPAFEPAFVAQRDAIEGLLREAVGAGLTVVAGSPGNPPKDVETG